MPEQSEPFASAVTFDQLFKRNYGSAKIGVFGCGLWAYWSQFPGLREKLIGYQTYFENRLREKGFDIVSGGLADNSQSAAAAGDRFRREGIDFLICYVSTYAISSSVVPVVQRANVPIVIVALQPTSAMDYKNGTTAMQLEHDQGPGLPELCCALRRVSVEPAGMIVGLLYDDSTWQRIFDWCKVARAYATVHRARIGLMGHTYEGMLDMNSDPTMFEAYFGLHCEHIEMDDLQVCVDEVTEPEVARKLDEVYALFDFPPPGADPIAGPAKKEDVEWAARVACGIDKLIRRFDLTGLAYYYRGLNNNAYERLGATMIVGSSLLTGQGIPIAGEYDVKNCVAMLMADRLEAGGSFAEIHPCDFEHDIVLVGHDGPHHVGVAQGRPVLRSLSVYHGKRGYGVGVEFQIKNGPITCVGLTQTHQGKFRLVVAEGESLPGPIPPTGNTNTRCRFAPDVRGFIENWSLTGATHHFALAVGHIGHLVEDFARCYGIECVNVTDPGYKRPQHIR